MRFLAICGLVAVFLMPFSTSAQMDDRLEEVLEFAQMFGYVSGAANQCRNLTVAKIPEVREAIRVYRRSETPAVRQQFKESRKTAIAGVRKDREQTCAFMAKTFPWFFEETRDKGK